MSPNSLARKQSGNSALLQLCNSCGRYRKLICYEQGSFNIALIYYLYACSSLEERSFDILTNKTKETTESVQSRLLHRLQ